MRIKMNKCPKTRAYLKTLGLAAIAGDMREELDEMEVENKRYRHLISFLSKLVSDYHDLRLHACGLTPEACLDYLMMKFPIIQGMQNKQNLRKIGNLSVDQEMINAGISQALKENEK